MHDIRVTLLRILATAALALLAACSMLQRKASVPVSAPSSATTRQDTAARPARPAAPTTAPKAVQGIAPHELGYYLDSLQGRLLQKLGRGITRSGKRIEVSLGDASDAAQRDQALRALASVLAEYKWTSVDVQCAPTAGKSQADALREARDVARQLAGHGVSAARLAGNAVQRAQPGVVLVLQAQVRDAHP